MTTFILDTLAYTDSNHWRLAEGGEAGLTRRALIRILSTAAPIPGYDKLKRAAVAKAGKGAAPP